MTMASLVPAIMTWTAWPAGTALEALAGASATAAFRTTTYDCRGGLRGCLDGHRDYRGRDHVRRCGRGAGNAGEDCRQRARSRGEILREARVRRRCAARSASFSGKQDDVVFGD